MKSDGPTVLEKSDNPHAVHRCENETQTVR